LRCPRIFSATFAVQAFGLDVAVARIAHNQTVAG
jgi:hypothetical protein